MDDVGERSAFGRTRSRNSVAGKCSREVIATTWRITWRATLRRSHYLFVSPLSVLSAGVCKTKLYRPLNGCRAVNAHGPQITGDMYVGQGAADKPVAPHDARTIATAKAVIRRLDKYR